MTTSETILNKSQILISIFFVCLLIGCNEDKSKSSSFNKESFYEHYIDDIKGTLLLPKEFQRISVENQAYVFSNVDSTSALRIIIRSLQDNRLEYVLFINEDHYDDFIIIRKTDHIDFTKQEANQYLGLVENSIRNSNDYLNYFRLQNKMTRTERSKYIKVKYKIDYQSGSIYRTQYVVTSNISTFEILESRWDTSTDYEDLIKRINYLVN